MGTLDPDEYQELLNAHDELDNVPVRLSRYQAQKCAAILTAGQDGHAAYADATVTVAQYLQALALDELPGIARTATDSATLWQILDDLPWPTAGSPAQQPDWAGQLHSTTAFGNPAWTVKRGHHHGNDHLIE